MDRLLKTRHQTREAHGDVEKRPESTSATSTLMRYGMWVCCAVMLLPVAAYFFAGGSLSGVLGNAGVFAWDCWKVNVGRKFG